MLAPIFKCLCKCFKCCKKKHKVKSKDFFKELSVLPLEQIYRKAKDDKDDFYANVFKNDDYAKKLAEKCGQYRFPEETELGTILNNLGAGYFERRQKQIELVIDSHLEHLHGNWRMSEFQGMEPESKLRYLLKVQLLVNKNERMRMLDITQSYDIKESVVYSKSKVVAEKLEENPNYQLN